MVNLSKQSTSYKVKSLEGSITVEGNFIVINGSNKILNLYLNFTLDGSILGTANYSEYPDTSNFNYTISNSDYKEQLISTTDKIIKEIKSLIK